MRDCLQTLLKRSTGGPDSSVAATWLEVGPASQSRSFCDSTNWTNPGKSRGSSSRQLDSSRD